MRVKKENKPQELLDKVYRFLAIRPRSKKELFDYLKRKKTLPPQTEKIFNLLKQQDLLNDSVFTGWWIDQRATFRPKGKIALKAELKQKGISGEIINLALAEIDELALARKALKKKPNLDKQKLINFLSYRGFSWETVRRVLKGLKQIDD